MTDPNQANPDAPMTLEAAADAYGISEEILKTLAMIGWIPGTKIGTGDRSGTGRWFFFGDQINRGLRDMAERGRHCPSVVEARRLRAEWREEHADERVNELADDDDAEVDTEAPSGMTTPSDPEHVPATCGGSEP